MAVSEVPEPTGPSLHVRLQRVGTATLLDRQTVVGAQRPTSGSARSAVPRKAAAPASAEGRTKRRLGGGTASKPAGRDRLLTLRSSC